MTSMMSVTTAEDTTDHSLPSFASFTAELEPSWDYYDRQERSNGSTNGGDVISSQTSNSSYTRPWEMDSKDQRAVIPNGGGGGGGGFEPFPKLPSFQSQFHGYNDTAMGAPEPSLPQVTAVPVPISPSSASPGTGGSLTQLTQLTPTPLTPLQSGLGSIGGSHSFHTLSAVNPRPYPIVPAPIQARDIPTMNQQYIDERHIQLYQPISSFQPQTIPTVTVIKNEVVDFDLSSIKNGTLHHSNFHSPLIDNNMFSQSGLTHHHTIQSQQQQQQQHQPHHQTHHHLHQPQQNLVTPSVQEHHITNHTKLTSSTTNLDSSTQSAQITRIADNRKKERRKMRAPSLESSAESEGSAMEIGDSGNPGQVAAISSTANFKSPMHTMSMDTDDGGIPGEKQTKKKRKRCGECVGCSRKDNCGDCAPCRNDKSHQICKTRRCEKLTEKKILYGPDGQLLKPESRRGRGKGRSSKAAAQAAAATTPGNNGGATTDANGTSGRGRKALNLGATPKNLPQNSSGSPAPASLPHPSPNTTTGAAGTPNVVQSSQLVTVSGAQTGINSTLLGNPSQPQQAQQQQQSLQQQVAQTIPTNQGLQQHQQHQPQQQQPPQTPQQVPTGVIKAETMKDQPQQPMAPMAFYPTWQADPSQGWQNQFIQQIPQNTPAITPLNSLEFQPQGYAAYQPNGYVQTAGIGFDPNYGRTYAAPPAVQRYEFQTNQITPINQVSLQSVSFAPTVTYAGQVSTGPAVVSHNPHDQFNLQLKQQTSGNDMPGYPRVNSVPPRSLNCNGYSGQQEYGGQTTTQASSATTNVTNANGTSSSTGTSGAGSGSSMYPPAQVPQSPNRQSQQQQPPRPNSNQQLYAQQSPNPYNSNGNNNLQQSPNHNNGANSANNNNVYAQQTHSGMHTPSPMQTPDNHQSPNHINHNGGHQQQQQQQSQGDWGGWNQQQQQSADLFNQSDRVNLNSRIKTMIMNKNDPKDVIGGGVLQSAGQHMTHLGVQSPVLGQGPAQQQTGHFLSYSHHLRDSLTPTTLAAGSGSNTASGQSPVPNSAMMGGGAGSGSNSSSNDGTIGDGGGLINSISNIVDPNWKQSSKSPGLGGIDSNNGGGAAIAGGSRAAEHEHHTLMGDIHHGSKHQGFEQKQQLIDKNNTDPGGGRQHHDTGGGGGGHDIKHKLNSSKSSSSSSSSSKSKNSSSHKNSDKHSKSKNNHHLDMNQQIDSNKSSNNLNSSYSSSSFMSEHHSSSSSSSPYPNLNQTYLATNHNNSSSSSSGGSNASSLALGGGYPSHLDSKLDDKSPLNRFRHDNLNSGFNPHLPHSQQTSHVHGGGAFHHPQTAGSGASSAYNLMNVKKEPGLLDESQPPKFDGYEKNYQNFIRYGDYNESSQPTQVQPPQHGSSVGGGTKSEYNSYYSPYGGYPGYQNYPNYHNQNFGNTSASGTLPLTPEANTPLPAITTPVAHQTNFEQQIPAHTYPIPKNNNLSQAADVPIKLETEDNSYLNNPASLDEAPTDNNVPVTAVNNIAGGSENTSESEAPPPAQTPASTPTTGGGGSSKSKKSDKKDKSNKDSPAQGEVKTEGGAGSGGTGGGASKSSSKKKEPSKKKELEAAAMKQAEDEKLEKAHKPEAPDCDCFNSTDNKPPSEPGSYYTHLGNATTLEELRRETENRVGLSGKQLRIEKVVYTGKEGKSSQGCPIAKWVIRRVDPEEKLLFIVKRRQGHRCKASFIVICIVVWDGIPTQEADSVYRMLAVKLNKYGLPTVRRCATNENRTCACQGLDPETCGVSYSFGCSWSMYYNGCKYARSKTVRKFRLSVKNEEAEIEERMNVLATMLSPLYVTVAPQAFQNQVQYEREAPDCRLGLKPGKPFSGVTCCLDFCAHTHRDLHNMQDGCTVQVTLLKPLPPGVKPDDEQLHILPLYTMDTTDEFDSEEGQKKKAETGAVQVLEKFPTEVRVRSTPLQPCRRHGKKRGNGKDEKAKDDSNNEESIPETPPPPPPPTKKESKSKSKKGSSNSSSTSNNSGGTNISNSNQNSQSSTGSLSPRAQTPGNNSIKSAGSAGNGNNGIPHVSKAGPNQGPPVGNNGSNSAFTPPNAINSPNNPGNGNSTLVDMASMIDNFTDAQLQSNQISSTVLDSPYSYDYNTGQYIDNRQYYNNWPTDYYGNRTDPNKMLGRNEEIPDTTTRPGSNSSNSAFSPSIPDPTKTPTPIHMDDYSSTKLTQQQSQTTYHTLQQPEQGFVKPKPPDYNPGYGYHPNTPMGYGYHPPYTPYDPYQNYNYGYPPQSYHPTYHNMYPTTQTQLPGTGPAPPPPPTAVIPAPPPPSNWNLYPPHPHHQTHISPAAPTQLHPTHQPHLGGPKQQDIIAPVMQQPAQPPPPPPPPKETLGEVTETNENLDCFEDPQMGGVSIALPHGSVVIECAKLEMHSTTALKKPNRLNPTRMTLIFYQHRNLNRPKHGIAEWAEKMRLKKLGVATNDPIDDKDMLLMQEDDIKAEPLDDLHHMRHMGDEHDMMDVEYSGV
ncbi:methylcytosine dioxygenase TET isoform X2 [Toxorhynchites rutilus septentrionalis]|uniref:methylcytosine dioxygenase TET isoform X2 n=1 Tax=Toxorhynchites rutilus septentrionalis TaxID=329112 RepID=UPI002478AE71|nr:methylcytosine dioxygenase TET isoform X2 [Toxorhynchites rutilus septentrionalis]